MPNETVHRWKIEAAFQALRKLPTPFRGPFITPAKDPISLVYDVLLTQPKIAALYRNGKLKPDDNRLLRDLRTTAGARVLRSQRNGRR